MCVHFYMSIKHKFYMEHYILCASMYVHSIALCASGGLSRWIPPVSVSAQFLTCSPGDDQGARGLLPIVCAYDFSVCSIQISQICFTVMWDLGQKLHTCILFIVYVHYIFMNATSYIRLISQYQLNQVFNFSISSASYFSIDILRFRFGISFQLYTCWAL